MNRSIWTICIVGAIACGAGWLGGVVPAAESVPPPDEYPHGEFREDCSSCHEAERWSPARIDASFNHKKFGFTLTGAHKDADCLDCHENLAFSETKDDCASCHMDVHRSELGSDCARCHSTRSFIDRIRMVRAHLGTRFPLRAAHASADCDSCHLPAAEGSLQYLVTDTECEACHLDEYENTTTVDHVAAGFPTDCSICHAPIGWEISRGDLAGAHRGTAFPLDGAHATLDCVACHVPLPDGTPQFIALDTACESCHIDDYTNAVSLDHVTAGFPTDCMVCHNTTAWDNVGNINFQEHDTLFFPIYSGPHLGRWDSCSTCHVSSSNFEVFSCLGCHPHSGQGETDAHHSEVGGYTYESNNCLSCHPDGTN